MSVRRVVGGIGRALVAFGVLLLLFVAYQLWGTGLQEARAQDRLRDEFEQFLATTTTSTTSTTVTTLPPDSTVSTSNTTSTTAVAAVPPPPPEGEAVARLRIPRIGVDKVVVEGVSVRDLKKAPGHYPTTPMPGQPGNAAVAGHRTTYGQPFYRLDELEPGDEIFVTTLQGRFRFEVDGVRIVRPDQTEVLAPTEEARLTLTTCHPRYSARKRLIVTARLLDEPAPAPPTTLPPAPTTTVPAEPGAPVEPTTTVAPEAAPPLPQFESAGLSGDRAAAGPTALWGTIAALIALATWLAARRLPKIPVYLVGGAIFLVALFVFYENVARLLPANI